MIVSKFKYNDIPRSEKDGIRHYVVNEQLLPSVTTILSTTKTNHFIEEWRDSIGHAEADRITKESSDLGTFIHENLERYIESGEDYQRGGFMSKQLTNLIIKKGLSRVDQVWGTEVPLYLTNLYAGTTDCVGVHDNDDSIIDFKNARNFRTEDFVQDYYLQLCAYAEAHNEMYGTNIKKGVIMMATQTGKYQEFILEGEKFMTYRGMWLDRLYQYYEEVTK